MKPVLLRQGGGVLAGQEGQESGGEHPLQQAVRLFALCRPKANQVLQCSKEFLYLMLLLKRQGVLVSFLELRFLRKMSLLALGGRPQPLKSPLKLRKVLLLENKSNK